MFARRGAELRGGIVDVFSYAAEHPFRIEFFGDEVDSIRTFDIETQFTEKTLKPGQKLRLGQVELELSEGAVSDSGGSSKGPSGPVADQTMVIQGGVSLSELENRPAQGFDTAGDAFSKKSNQVNRYFVIGGAIIGVVILAVIIFAVLFVAK